MKYIDCHCDTLTELKTNETLRENKRNVTLNGLISAGCLVQCCSAFIPTGILKEQEKIDREYDRILARYKKELDENKDFLKAVLTYQDIKECVNEKKTGILLTIEDGGVLHGDMDNLYKVCKDGVRLITLTWNHENEIGYPNSTDSLIMKKGLKAFGFDMLEEMCRLGIIVDVSHLSDGGFCDVADFMKRKNMPFIASHSNARAVCAHPRNLPDSYIKKIADIGGIMGLNFAAHFLNENEEADGSSTITDMVRHVLHIRNVGGSEVLAIGSDFDGVQSRLEIDCPEKMNLLYEALHKAGLPDSELEKMFYKNALRVFEKILP
jgi:membrane dipeptidase